MERERDDDDDDDDGGMFSEQLQRPYSQGGLGDHGTNIALEGSTGVYLGSLIPKC